MLGWGCNKVKVVPYNPSWKEAYRREEGVIRKALSELLMDIRHIGSTSVPGMVARPEIDIVVGIGGMEMGPKCIGPLKVLGYQYIDDSGNTGRMFFTKDGHQDITYNLYLVKWQGANWKRYLLFRDLLRWDTHTAKEYIRLKMELADKYRKDEKSYTTFKLEFVEKVLDGRL